MKQQKTLTDKLYETLNKSTFNSDIVKLLGPEYMKSLVRIYPYDNWRERQIRETIEYYVFTTTAAKNWNLLKWRSAIYSSLSRKRKLDPPENNKKRASPPYHQPVSFDRATSVTPNIGEANFSAAVAAFRKGIPMAKCIEILKKKDAAIDQDLKEGSEEVASENDVQASDSKQGK